jgi:two-component system cell cycle response regulator DivK
MATDTGQERTILIVDDNRDGRELAAKILKAKGFRIIEAIDGEDALQKVMEKPDLVLMDISLPKLDGYEVTRRLKSQEIYKDIPVIALTAHAMKGDREKALAAGCDGYIPKPINIRELPDQVEKFLK